MKQWLAFFRTNEPIIMIAIRAAVAMALSFLVTYYVLALPTALAVITAMFASIVTTGTPFRQGLLVTITCTSAIALVYILSFAANIMAYYLAVCLITMCVYVLITYFEVLYNHAVYLLFVFYFLFVMTAFKVDLINVQTFTNALYAVFAGGVIGMTTTKFLLPIRQTKSFTAGLIPVIDMQVDIATKINAYLSQYTNDDEALKNIKAQQQTMLMMLTAENSTYPDWVFEVGFNPGLRSGYRYILLRIERLSEIYASLMSLPIMHITVEHWEKLTPAIKTVMSKNIELLQALSNRLAGNKIVSSGDYDADITQLNAEFKEFAPSDLQLLDLHPGYIALASIVQDVKDMRNVLLQLMIAALNN